MANIALLNRCNLKCPYCFAENYRGEEAKDISLEAFSELLSFCAEENTLGLIGGEPFLHKSINEILSLLIEDRRFREVTVFTNGIYIDKSLDLLSHYKFKLLVNVNSSEDVGSVNFEKMRSNLKEAFSAMRGRVDLGLNIYKESQDFSEFLALADELGVRRVRISVVIPQKRVESGIEYFKRMKPTLLSLYRELSSRHISPCYDCNAIPECVFTEDELSFLSTLPFNNGFERSIFLGQRSVCSPVIDLYPDLTATRCFGVDGVRVPISEFKCLSDLRNFFFKVIDCSLVNKPASPECEQCYKYKTFSCFGGCLCYKK